MRQRLQARLTYANVVATLALFLALGGGAYAAATLRQGSVTTREIRDRGLKGRDLATGAVGSRAILDRSITQKDLSAAVRSGIDGARGPAGPTGAPGAAGAAGAALVASKDFGAFDAARTALTTLPGDLRWTQPAGTYDELRGVVEFGPAPACGLADLGVQVVLDGKEISPDLENGTPDAIPDAVYSGAGSHALAIERAAEPAAAATDHVLTVRAADDTACTNPIPVSSLRLYVLRFVR